MALAVDVTLCVAMKDFTKVGCHEDVSYVESVRFEGAGEIVDGPLFE